MLGRPNKWTKVYDSQLQNSFTDKDWFCKAKLHCKNFEEVSTNYYLVTSSTEMLRSVNFWLQSVAWIVLFFFVGSTFTDVL